MLKMLRSLIILMLSVTCICLPQGEPSTDDLTRPALPSNTSNRFSFEDVVRAGIRKIIDRHSLYRAIHVFAYPDGRQQGAGSSADDFKQDVTVECFMSFIRPVYVTGNNATATAQDPTIFSEPTTKSSEAFYTFEAFDWSEIGLLLDDVLADIRHRGQPGPFYYVSYSYAIIDVFTGTVRGYEPIVIFARLIRVPRGVLRTRLVYYGLHTQRMKVEDVIRPGEDVEDLVMRRIGGGNGNSTESLTQ